MTQTTTPQVNAFFRQGHALAASLDQDTLDALADRYSLDDLRKRRANPRPTPLCLSCKERPCSCGKEVYRV